MMEYIKLRNGIDTPILGYGTFQIVPKQTKQCILNALQEGYRLIDTSASYFNEAEIGEAIQESGINRQDIFITTKVWIQDAGYEKTMKAFQTSLKKLKVDYIDLYLIHQPYGDYYGSWRALEDLYHQGKVKAIGVCNFSAERFVDLYMNCSTPPMINQVEMHPFFQQKELQSVLKNYGCQLEAWGPLAEGQRQIFQNETLKMIAQKHHKTVTQIILRWHIQNHIIAIPKTVDQKRMKENMDIWNFELDEEDLNMILSLDLGYSEIINHQNYKTAKWLNQYKIHEEEE